MQNIISLFMMKKPTQSFCFYVLYNQRCSQPRTLCGAGRTNWGRNGRGARRSRKKSECDQKTSLVSKTKMFEAPGANKSTPSPPPRKDTKKMCQKKRPDASSKPPAAPRNLEVISDRFEFQVQTSIDSWFRSRTLEVLSERVAE